MYPLNSWSFFWQHFIFRTKFTTDAKLMPSAHTDSLVRYGERNCAYDTYQINSIIIAIIISLNLRILCTQFLLEVLFLMFHLKCWCYLAVKAYWPRFFSCWLQTLVKLCSFAHILTILYLKPRRSSGGKPKRKTKDQKTENRAKIVCVSWKWARS